MCRPILSHLQYSHSRIGQIREMKGHLLRQSIAGVQDGVNRSAYNSCINHRRSVKRDCGISMIKGIEENVLSLLAKRKFAFARPNSYSLITSENPKVSKLVQTFGVGSYQNCGLGQALIIAWAEPLHPFDNEGFLGLKV